MDEYRVKQPGDVLRLQRHYGPLPPGEYLLIDPHADNVKMATLFGPRCEFTIPSADLCLFEPTGNWLDPHIKFEEYQRLVLPQKHVA
jgi:hypothetical protein